MRVFDQGSEFKVTVSPKEVYTFVESWPCAHFKDKCISFTFKKRNGDLVDMFPNDLGSSLQNGREVLALSHQAQFYGATKLKLKNALPLPGLVSR